MILYAILTGLIYFKIMEDSIPTESNCSYLASPLTDYLAFVAGAMLIAYDTSPVATFIGTALITEHMMQLLKHKVKL